MQATVVTVVVIGIFTVGPYLWNKSHPTAASAQATIEPPSTPRAQPRLPRRLPRQRPNADPSATATNDKSKQPAIDKTDTASC